MSYSAFEPVATRSPSKGSELLSLTVWTLAVNICYRHVHVGRRWILLFQSVTKKNCCFEGVKEYLNKRSTGRMNLQLTVDR